MTHLLVRSFLAHRVLPPALADPEGREDPAKRGGGSHEVK